MRTTLDLPDALAKQAKLAAVRRGKSLKALVVEALEHELQGGKGKPQGAPLQFPIVRSAKPGLYVLSPRDIHDILVREETAAYEASQRR